MKQLKFQRPGESCMLYAAAMCLGITPVQLSDLIGHDGSAIMYPTLVSPLCYRGVGLCEINVAIARFRLHFGTVHANPTVEVGGFRRALFDDPTTTLEAAIKNQSGILVGLHENGIMHAVALDTTGKMYDAMHTPKSLHIAYFHPLCGMNHNPTALFTHVNYQSN